jgi:hypothetical protein
MQVDKEGYEIVPPNSLKLKGVKCGVCNMKFEHGKAYGMVCTRSNCTMFVRIE